MNLLYKVISFFTLIIVSIFAVAIAIVNTDVVSFNYYFNQSEVSLSLLLAFTFIAGVLISFILVLPTLIRLKYLSVKNKKLQNKITTAQLKLFDTSTPKPN